MASRLWILSVLAAAVCWSCAEKADVSGLNKPPDVWIASGPPEGAVTDYRVHFYWGGWDPDGEVVYYEYAIADNETGVFDPADTMSTSGDYAWTRIDGNEGDFAFSADEVADSTDLDDSESGPYQFARSHTFFIRSVDDRGARSPKPAHRSFTATTLSPTVYVDYPPITGLNAAQIPNIATFRWTGIDEDGDGGGGGEPLEVRHVLVAVDAPPFDGDWDAALAHIRDPSAPEWSEWRDYSATDESGRRWSPPALQMGRYLFAAQAKDEAGAVTPVFDLGSNLRRILVGSDFLWPVLTVVNPFIGRVRSGGLGGSAGVRVDLPAGLPIAFEWSGKGYEAGQIVTDYRYGWGVFGPGDEDQWSEWTPFIGEKAKSPPRTFFFGTQTFNVEIRDNLGFVSRVTIDINIVPLTMERDLLLVDDWVEPGPCFAENGGTTPCDAEHDAFWETALASVANFNPTTDVIALREGSLNSITLNMLARYRSVIWVADGSSAGESASFLNSLIDFKSPDSFNYAGTIDLLAAYMAVGGHVLLCGQQIMALVINSSELPLPRYPLIFRYELGGDQDGTYDDYGKNELGRIGVGEGSFAYNVCCLNVLDATYVPNSNQTRRGAPGAQRCPVDQIRDHDQVADGLRTALPLDVMTGPGFPQLDLRPEVAGQGKFYESVGLIADIYNPAYFSAPGMPCASAAETDPPRSCFQPIYGNGCNSTLSVIYNDAVAFWTSRYADRVPEAGGVAARSAVWGFHPVFFETDEVKEGLQVILHDEWALPRR